MGGWRILELAVGLVLASGVVAKVARPAGFLSAVREFRFLSRGAATGIAVVAIGAEAVVAILLLGQIAPPWGLAGAALLFGAFGIASWLQVREAGSGGAECGCLGGTLRLRHSLGAVVLNGGVAILCLAGAAVATFGDRGGESASSGESVLIGALALLMAAIYWTCHYAISVISEVEAQANEQGGQA